MEPSPLTILAVGFLLGMEHALDADHMMQSHMLLKYEGPDDSGTQA
jgi:hypothetical protein